MTVEAPSALLFAPPESQGLGCAIGEASGLPLAALEAREFEDGEFKLRPMVSVRNRSVFVIQTLAPSPERATADRLVRLLFLLSALRDGGAAQVTAVIPYLAYARKDRRTQPRDPIHTRYVAQLLESAGIDRLLAVDVHNPAALDNAFRVGVDHLSALPMFAAQFSRRLHASDPVIASPDVGGIKRAQILCELMQVRLGHPIELAFLEKRRAGGIARTGAVVGAVGGRPVLLLDDLCASGGTLRRAAESLRSAGASAVHVAVTHAPNPAGLRAALQSEYISDLTVTDTVGTDLGQRVGAMPGRLEILPIAPLLGAVIRRPLHGATVAELLEQAPAELP